ncbi:MAG: peptidoglycan DD-metalloendopeptidase family protein [Ruminococcaceae bacterium]|nr:peptidoglycan DD-metalloendopeptidase family protein [Oscillospiraceae bacterium]
MTIIKALATWSECYKANQKITPSGIVVHSTGANNPYLKRYVKSPAQLGENIYKNWWGTGSIAEQEKSGIPHAAIGKDKNGKVAAAQVLPFNMRCWGCGSGKYGSYNATHIQFEICEDALTDKTYFEAAFDLAAQFCAELMQTYPSIKLENIVSHKEACARGYASNHGDPENWLSKFGKDMNWFRDKVKSYGTVSANSNAAGSTSKVVYAKLSELIGTTSASITTTFKEKGSCWSSGWHNGIDIACAANTPIKAAADGVVVNADTVSHTDGYGNRVVIRHPDGKATLYAHMIAPSSVKVGQSVKKGQVIGKVGSTGMSTGAHLHISVIDNYDKNPDIYYKGELLDPAEVLGLGTLGGATALKVGDTVNFTGTVHYSGSTATSGKTCKPGKAKVTKIVKGTPHPIHLVNDGTGSTVRGWVDEKDVQ